MPPSDKKADAKQRRRKHGKQPTQHDPRGHPVMLVGPTGKQRMAWSPWNRTYEEDKAP